MDRQRTTHSPSECLLLSFAHRGEARAFLQEYKAHQLQTDFYELDTPFESLDVFLLITGEGYEDSMTNLSYILGKYPQINKMINYGVCGLLRKDLFLEINDLVGIRTVYADNAHQESKKMSFKSFTLDSAHSTEAFDIVTTRERILSREKADYLDNFSALVDRELWAQAFVANRWDIPLSSYKVISDYADGEICEQVKESSPLWSDQLLRHFIENQESPKQRKIREEALFQINAFFNEGDKEFFHITLSQERSLQRLLQAHHIKGHEFEELKEKIYFSQLLEKKMRPKDRTKELVISLSETLNPMELRLKNQLKTLTYPIEKLSAQVKHDQDYDKEKLHLSMTLQSAEDFQRLGEALQRFPYKKWTSILRGEDV